MSRYIDLKELEKRINENIKPETLEEKALIEWCKDECIRQGYAMPTADVVEVRHGRWLSAYEYAIKLGETNPYRLGIAEHDKIWHFCSLCEQQVRFIRNFCPECGAKMDGERRDDGTHH